MVHVRKVDIYGFKSFGFRNTTVGFEPGLVSISGPNGSGKSNILDAIIFAMGEKQAKRMRADKLSSLVHDIEGRRGGTRMARVNVTFDNEDRKIPVNADTVDITREMDEKGESTYYLNKKQSNRSQIVDMLDVANAGLSNLNAVQQGTVTRISEYTSDEKRETIEDLIGLSTFDEKKAEAEKQLDEADRRLEVALAKMGEVKSRIDELEVERNEKLRHDMLQAELLRLEGISAAARLRVLDSARAEKSAELATARQENKTLSAEKDAAVSESSGIEKEKSEFMAEADAFNQAKAELDTQLSGARRDHDEAESAIKTAQKSIQRLEARIPESERAISGLHEEIAEADTRIGELGEMIKGAEARRSAVDAEMQELDSRLAGIRNEQNENAKRTGEAEAKRSALAQKANEERLRLSRASSSLGDIDRRAAATRDAQEKYTKQSAELARLLATYESRIASLEAEAGDLRARRAAAESRRDRISGEIEDLGGILEKSAKAAAQYEAKIRVVRGIMHEDYSISQLQGDAHRLGITGMAYQMVSWDKKYERAALAVGADWIKAFVVPDFATLTGLAEVARQKGLPKLRIIPAEALPDLRAKAPRGRGVRGMMSEFVRSRPEHARLRMFLFGDVVLVDGREEAYRLSKQGHRAVTMDGELFEADASAVVVDINSKISNLTRIITMSSSVEGLHQSISLLKKYVSRKKASLKKVHDSLSAASEGLVTSETGLASARQSLADTRIKAEEAAENLSTYEGRLEGYSSSRTRLKAAMATAESAIESIEGRIELVHDNYAEGQRQRLAADLEMINGKKSAVERRRTEAVSELSRLASEQGLAEAGKTRLSGRISDLEAEIKECGQEKAELESSISASQEQMAAHERALVELRQKEQELIETSGTSVGRMAEYDERLKALHETERGLSGRIAELERKSDALERDLELLTGERAGLVRTIESSGVGRDAEAFETGQLVAGIRAELERLKELNSAAPARYVEVSSGYRETSTRKNALEKDRNSIVRFIEEVERDKKQTFLDAFDKVDTEIRAIFSKMTGGEAWLELQDEDEIFNSGISYLIKFPNKPKRESTSISGGEKTLAAVVFVLALQRLAPSPFYLFDEVDAHLDAPNTEKLSNILAERAQESQFIMVSLKDSVVQKAGLIYGVFPKNGVSNVVTYKDKRMPKVAS